MKKRYVRPAQIKRHPVVNFLQHVKIQPPYFAGQIKSTNDYNRQQTTTKLRKDRVSQGLTVIGSLKKVDAIIDLY